MKHENYHELLALRLYGELSADEERILARHLAECPECGAFGRELEQALGAVKRADDALRHDELPADWAARLRTATRREARPVYRLRALGTFAAGLAAGLLLTWSAGRGLETPGPPLAAGVTVVSNSGERYTFVARNDPPPRTTTRGQLAQLQSYIGR